MMKRNLLKISTYKLALRLSVVMFFFLLEFIPAIAKTIPLRKYDVQVVSGKVTDDKGLALPGVTVLIKGTKNGTVTDKNGYYSINVADNKAVLQFRFIGFVTREEQVNERNEINIVLTPDNNNLNEVVVVAYGVQKKVDLTGAVSQISGKELQDRPVANVSQALQGMIAGLNVTTNGGGGAPDATKSLNVRGFTGLDGSLAGPLVLVDGVETNINSINANDIASISLLKDVASSAIYGSRAPNGVLLITTKEGKKNQAPELTYTDNFSFAQPLNLPVMSNSLVFAKTYNEAALNGGLAPIFPDDVLARIAAYIKDPQHTPTTIVTPGTTTWSNYSYPYGNANNDWYKIFFKSWVPNQQHNLSLTGGGDRVTYFVGVGTNDNKGLYNYFKDSYKRDNVRFNLAADINKYVSFSLKTTYSQENDNNPQTQGQNPIQGIYRTWPIIALTDPNGGGDGLNFVTRYSQDGRFITRINDSRINGNITIKPLPGWNIIGDYSYDYNTSNFTGSYFPYFFATTTSTQNTDGSASSVEKQNTFTNYWTYNVFTSYEKNINGHYFKILGGEQAEENTYSLLNGYNNFLYSNSLPSLALTSGPNPTTTDAGGYTWATARTFGKLDYNYKEKYLFQANAAYMGTSLFPQNSRYHLFSSYAAGWNIAKEAFFKPLSKQIQNFKIRISYGGTGDIASLLNAGNYYPSQSFLTTQPQSSTSWIFTPSSGGRQPYVSSPTNLVSPTLTWAKPSMLNIGADIDFLTDFNLTADWYRKNITDQFGGSTTPPATLGIAAPLVNVESSVTKGWEVTLAFRHKYGDFNVNARANISHYSGKVTQYNGNPAGLLSLPYAGEPIGAIWGYTTVGKFQSEQQIANAPSQSYFGGGGFLPGDIQYADLNHDGKISPGSNTVSNHGDLSIIGNTTPKFLYGFNAGVSWKGFSLNLFIQGQGRADIWDSNIFNLNGGLYFSEVTPKLADRWTPSNPNGYFPRIDLSNGPSKDMQVQSYYLQNTEYLRLKNVQFGYTVPNRITQKFHVSDVRIYTSIENLLTFSPVFAHQYVDPELMDNGDLLYPLQRTYSFGIQLNVR